VRWIYRAKLPDNAADDRAAQTLASDARTALPSAGGKSAPAAMPRRSWNAPSSRFTQFLTLVGLAALLVGGVGVANAVKKPYRSPP